MNDQEMTAKEFCDYTRSLFLGGLLLLTDIEKNPKAIEKLETDLKRHTSLDVLLNFLSAIDYELGELGE
jgi:hypothetical protein